MCPIHKHCPQNLLTYQDRGRLFRKKKEGKCVWEETLDETVQETNPENPEQGNGSNEDFFGKDRTDLSKAHRRRAEAAQARRRRTGAGAGATSPPWPMDSTGEEQSSP